jgi:hypothetical protein
LADFEEIEGFPLWFVSYSSNIDKAYLLPKSTPFQQAHNIIQSVVAKLERLWSVGRHLAEVPAGTGVEEAVLKWLSLVHVQNSLQARMRLAHIFAEMYARLRYYRARTKA